jgi:FlaA1/EpsC-like NDP-sugar epimerase
MRLPGFLTQFATQRFVALLAGYTVTLGLCFWLAYLLRFDFALPAADLATASRKWPWVVALKLALLFVFGQFSGLLSYFSIPDFRRIVLATGTASGLLFLARYAVPGYPTSPRSVVLLDFVLSTGAIVSIRLLLRMFRERYLTLRNGPTHSARRVGIVGAGDVGATLVRELQSKRGLGLTPAVFFDDDPTKWRSYVHGVPVAGRPELLLDGRENLRLDEVIIAMPAAGPKRMREVIEILQKSHLKFETVPSMEQLATGKVRVSRLRAVEISDLLGRAPVKLAADNIRQLLQGRVVMVTGAGGSIGSELCRQIAGFDPQRLLLVDQSEVQLFQIEQELLDLGYGGVIVPLVADVLDAARMRQVFNRFAPGEIFHAAAHKHVPMMEHQPSEAIKNNVLGTAQTAELALEFRAQRFVMISTDKAINPTSVMGATKRLAEIFLQSFAAQGGATRFMAVRFGNVLGSSGSVIPVFNRQIAAGGPVKVTHPDVTRYFMTIPEAAGLVLQSAAQGVGGEIFVLDMGEPVRIQDLARQLIQLNGLRPDEDIPIEFIGLRPGEKLFEELSYKGENHAPTEHPKIMRFSTQPAPMAEVRAGLAELTYALHQAESNQIKLLLKKLVPEYQPHLTAD